MAADVTAVDSLAESLLREHADAILTKANAVPPSGGGPL